MTFNQIKRRHDRNVQKIKELKALGQLWGEKPEFDQSLQAQLEGKIARLRADNERLLKLAGRFTSPK